MKAQSTYPIEDSAARPSYLETLYRIPKQPPIPQSSSHGLYTLFSLLPYGRKDNTTYDPYSMGHLQTTLRWKESTLITPLPLSILFWPTFSIRPQLRASKMGEVPIHKSSNPMSPSNQKATMIYHMLAKIYGAVLKSVKNLCKAARTSRT